jgi:hypothetical protein
MRPVTKDDLDELKNDLKEHIDLKFQALPCEAHADKVAAVEKMWPEVRDLQTWKDRLLGAWTFVTVAFSIAIAYLGLKHH